VTIQRFIPTSGECSTPFGECEVTPTISAPQVISRTRSPARLSFSQSIVSAAGKLHLSKKVRWTAHRRRTPAHRLGRREPALQAGATQNGRDVPTAHVRTDAHARAEAILQGAGI
jgi:hypothetical protein